MILIHQSYMIKTLNTNTDDYFKEIFLKNNLIITCLKTNFSIKSFIKQPYINKYNRIFKKKDDLTIFVFDLIHKP